MFNYQVYKNDKFKVKRFQIRKIKIILFNKKDTLYYERYKSYLKV